MKKEYPKYNIKLKNEEGETILLMDKIESKIPSKDKKLINNFLEYCKINSKSETARKGRARTMIQIYDVFEKPLSIITLKNLRDFLVVVNNSSLSPSTQNDVKSLLKRFLRWHYKNWSKRFDDFRDIKMKDERNHEKINASTMLTEREIEILIRTTEKLRYKALIMLAFESAGRPEELLKLKWNDIDTENKRVKLYSVKTKRARINELKESIIHLERYRQEFPFPNVSDSDFVFPTPRNRNKQMTGSAFSGYIKELGKRAGIRKPIWPYLLRHTRLSPLIQELSPKAYVKFAGHSLDTGMYYYGHLSESKLSAEIMEKVYSVKEPTLEQKNKYEKDIFELKEQMSGMRNAMVQFQNMFESMTITNNQNQLLEPTSEGFVPIVMR